MVDFLASAIAFLIIAALLTLSGILAGGAAGVLTLPALGASPIRRFNDHVARHFFDVPAESPVPTGQTITTYLGLSLAYAVPYVILMGLLAAVASEVPVNPFWWFTAVYWVVGPVAALWWAPRNGFDWDDGYYSLETRVVFLTIFTGYYVFLFGFSLVSLLAVLSPLASLG